VKTLYLKQIALSTKYHWNKQNQNRMERLINCVKHQNKLVIILERSENSHG